MNKWQKIYILLILIAIAAAAVYLVRKDQPKSTQKQNQAVQSTSSYTINGTVTKIGSGEIDVLLSDNKTNAKVLIFPTITVTKLTTSKKGPSIAAASLTDIKVGTSLLIVSHFKLNSDSIPADSLEILK